MPRARNVYQKGTNIFLMCRVCLTQSSSTMYDLDGEVEIDTGLPEKMLVVAALQKVTSKKVPLNKHCPKFICPMCLSLLKMSLKFIIQFEESQMKLNAMFDSDMFLNDEIIYCDNISTQKRASVEVIYNNKKFNLNELLVVEPAKDENVNFNGFLNNLGNEISATFVDELEQDHKIKGEEEGTVSVLIKNKNRILPVKELQIDEDANLVNYTVDESVQESTEPARHEILFEEDGQYIQVENDNIDSFIFERDGEEINCQTSDINTIHDPTKRKYAKRKKEEELEKSNDDDIFEREIKLACETCGGIFSTKRHLRAHIKRAHQPRVRKYTCEICGHVNNTRSAFMNHKVKHTGKQFVCEMCKKPYYTKANLKVHMETHTNKRQHLCSVCGKGFNYANALVYHMRLHTGEKNYKCEYCQQTFRMSNSLRRHVRVHTGERPYMCKYCDKSFCSKGEVSCHEHIHTGFRPYHCKYCKKGFSKTHNLKLHLLSHDGPHQCEICSKTFIEMAILAMHYKISHKNILPIDEEINNEDYGNYI